MTDEDKDEIGPIECARLWGVSPKAVRSWANKGKIPYRRTPSGRLKFSKRVMLEMVEAYTGPPVDYSTAGTALVPETPPVAAAVDSMGHDSMGAEVDHAEG